MPITKEKTPTTNSSAKQSPTSQSELKSELLNGTASPPQHQSPNQSSPHQSPSESPAEPNLSGGASSDAGELGEDFTSSGQEQQPEPEVLPPELLTAEEFARRFASWFDAPGAVLGGQPTEEMRDRAARALHAEIVKSGSTWFRALASRRVGSIGNWGIVALFAVSLMKNMADLMQARATAAPNGSAGAPEGGQQWPPKAGM